jgi:arginyl-tRNA synthetase
LKYQVVELIEQALEILAADNAGAIDTSTETEVEPTRDPRHGHYASNIAMRLAKTLGQPPRQVAQSIIERLPESELVESVEIAGPGFINFHLSGEAFHRELGGIIDRGSGYGNSSLGAGHKVLLEYVSANPTGPLHVGHGRHAAYGDSVARILKATGFEVLTEYYVNDAGRQMDILTLSVWLRMLEDAGADIPFPSGAYRGQYVRDVAAAATESIDPSSTAIPDELFVDLPSDETDSDAHLDQLIERARTALGETAFLAILDTALHSILADIREDLAEFGVCPDEWFSERSLDDRQSIHKALKLLEKSGMTYERDGAVWFRATNFGDEKDRVVVRENGRTTYFASDIAYHLHKRERGFETLIDVLGADHHGYVARVRAGLEAMGEPRDSLEVQLVQFVVLFRGGKKVQMSTRSGDFVTLRQLREEVGNDAARLFFVLRSNEQHLDFDLDLAKARSNENPVYYIQYAHARVCSVLRELKVRGYAWDSNVAQSSLGQLTEDHERALIQQLTRFPETLDAAARQRAPQHIAHYIREVAQNFHMYYNAHRFIVEDNDLRNARVMLLLATQQVLQNGLGLLGVDAPESM